MTENLKSIVQSVNKCLKTEFNLISFDSQADESLLQVLLDVFQKFEVINGKVREIFPVFLVLPLTLQGFQWDVKENDPEETNKTILECLAKIQYTDESMDIGALRRGLVSGDKKIIFPVFEWIFENEDLILKLAYLAR